MSLLFFHGIIASRVSCADDNQAVKEVTLQVVSKTKTAGLVVSAHGGQRKSVTQTVAACEVGSSLLGR
ncbi:hypothetical protein [Xenorhabdus nematophila]|uniref:hypothetical protein n=1 Tax=Xenorhabdus nematophila TaxID=628 RepID=UPI001269D5EC|nr:hypothetical protein [Xenorhabdus nematophila]